MPIALITGAGAPRIGSCVVDTLAQRGYGVVIHANRSIDAAQETALRLEARGTQALAVRADVRDEAQVTAMTQAALDRFGRIDALVNCAAIWQSRPLEDVTAEDVRRHFEINTLGTFLCCQAVGLAMTRQETGGAIVNFGDWAVERPYLNYAAYFPSKGAIETLTRDFAIELASRNPEVRVNAVFPGPAMLPDDLPQAERDAAIAGTLVKREGHPRNIADAVVFLLENDFVTGVCLRVDGGRSVFSGE